MYLTVNTGYRLKVLVAILTITVFTVYVPGRDLLRTLSSRAISVPGHTGAKSSQNRQGIVAERLRTAAGLVFGSANGMFFFQGSGIAQTGDFGGFDIDGDLMANTPTADVSDWVPGPGGSGEGMLDGTGTPYNPAVTKRVIDLFDSDLDNVFKPGVKHDDNPNTWTWVQQKSTAKDDINNALMHISTDSSGDLWFVVGGDRLSTTGDSYIDIELWQNPVTANADGTFTASGPHGGRTLGDIEITVHYQQGGGTAEYFIERWVSVGAGYGWVTLTSPANAGYIAGNEAGPVSVPFGAFGSTTYATNAFIEAAINISAVIENIDPCLGISSVLIMTKASQSESATLKDFAGPVPFSFGTKTTATDLAAKTVCQGASATFSTTASGLPPLTYQWKLDGSVIPGTANSLTIDTTGVSVGPHTVEVIVTGTCGVVTRSATLTVQGPPAATDLVSQEVCQGITAQFSTTPSGVGPFTYSWKLDGSAIPGEISSSISISTLPLAIGAHNVEVTVTGACGQVVKSATLTVLPVTAATDLSPATVCQGATANLATTASGTGPFTYAWKLDGAPIGGTANSNAIDTTSLSIGTHTVEVVVTGTCGAVTKSTTLNVQANTTVADLTPATVCQGATANFTAVAGGTGPFSYVWKVDDVIVPGGEMAMISTGALSIGPHTVTVEVTGTCGAAMKSTTLTVQANTTLADLTPATVCQGATANFTAVPSGTGPFSYVWKVDDVIVPGGEMAMISTGALSIGPHTVTVEVTGTCGSAMKSTTLTVQANTTVADLTPQTVCQGATANFTAAAGGTGPFSYVWKVDDVIVPGGEMAMISTGSLSIGPHTVTVEVTGTCG
ncbi:MAG: hypothetical protein AB7U64_19005, partial [Blastocatellales bacterium]